MIKLSEVIEFPNQLEHSKDCLYVREPRYFNNPAKEKYCNCGAFDFNEALKECDADVELDVDKLANIIKYHPVSQLFLMKYKNEMDKILKDIDELAQTIANNLPNLLRRKE